MNLVIVAIISYLVGAIPFSFIFSKAFKGVDIRKAGTGNVGATNVLISAGAAAGILALFFDFAKGFAAVVFARWFVGSNIGIMLAGIFAVLGHDFSVYLRFKGGKGVATTGGAVLAISPVVYFSSLALWAFLVLVTRYFIFSTVLVICALPALMWVAKLEVEYIVFAALIAGLAVFQHREDLVRTFKGLEPKVNEAIKKRRGVAQLG